MNSLFKLNFFLCVLVKLSTQNIVWIDNVWAFACDFNGNNLANVKVRGEDCLNTCAKTSGCTHFTWTSFNGGTCWMKTGPIKKSDAIFTNDKTMVCGVLESGTLGSTGLDMLKGSILWSDDFNSQADFEKNWIQETGGHGWGNDELQYYTNNNQNTEISGGMLTIHTRKESKNGNRFTSARLISSKKFRHGIFEMRAKLPYGRGTWPAFWLLAAKKPLSWPLDGEIDIMEHVGYDMNTIHATIHCKTYNHVIGTEKTNSIKINNVSDQFHLYQVYWDDKTIKAYIDNQQYFTYDRPNNSNYENWPYNNEFNIILNTAVGGKWGGAHGLDENIYPQKFVIDYVRQYSIKY